MEEQLNYKCSNLPTKPYFIVMKLQLPSSIGVYISLTKLIAGHPQPSLKQFVSSYQLLLLFTENMAIAYHSSTLLLLLVVSLTSMFSTEVYVEARHLLETTLPELPKPELPSLPKVELPKPELPQLPKVELPPLPHVPTLPKPELPNFPKPELPHFPELPHMPEVPELPKPVLPTLPKDMHIPSIPFPHSNNP